MTEGKKYDSGKPRWSLLPKGAVASIVDVLEFGAKKYAENNWQLVPDGKTRYYDAAMRHLEAWHNGELNDPETGLPHLAHAGCCLMFLGWLDGQPVADALDVEGPSRQTTRETDGWIEWNGGECPVGAHVSVEYVCRNRETDKCRANNLRWKWVGTDGDIIKYRVVK
jgi:hypothetical protein